MGALARLKIGRALRKLRKTEITSDQAREMQALRINRRGGRPRSQAKRCHCKAMTAKRAKARGHRC